MARYGAVMAMGNQMYTVHAFSEEEKDEFLEFVSARK